MSKVCFKIEHTAGLLHNVVSLAPAYTPLPIQAFVCVCVCIHMRAHTLPVQSCVCQWISGDRKSCRGGGRGQREIAL